MVSGLSGSVYKNVIPLISPSYHFTKSNYNPPLRQLETFSSSHIKLKNTKNHKNVAIPRHLSKFSYLFTLWGDKLGGCPSINY